MEKEIEEEEGDDYTLDLAKHYSEIAEEERHDIIPEFWNGHNIADYIDPDIFEKLEELEREEGLRLEGGFYDAPPLNIDDTLQEIREMAKQIRLKRFLLRDNKRLTSKHGKPTIPRHKLPHTRERKVEKLVATMENLGVDMSGNENANFTKNVVDLRRSMDVTPKKPRLDREASAIVRSTGQPIKRRHAKHELGIKDVTLKKKAKLMAKKDIEKKVAGRYAMKGEADRFIGDKMPKHLFSGKRGVGKTDRR